MSGHVSWLDSGTRWPIAANGRAYVSAIERVAAVRQLPRAVSASDQASGGARARKVHAATPSWSGALDCVMLNPPIGRFVRGGRVRSERQRPPQAQLSVTPARTYAAEVDANGQAEGGARAWKI
jgi:hypothetical protein